MEQEKCGCKNPEEKEEVSVTNRRSVLRAMLVAGAAGVAGVGALLPVTQYVLFPANAQAEETEWSDVGDIGEFTGSKGPVHKTVTFAQRDGWREETSEQSVYVGRTASGELKVLSAICPHMGCGLSWQDGQDAFVCPCHGGRFASDGKHLFGPPPRSMDCLATRVTDDGKLQVRFEYFRSNLPKQEKLI